MNAWGLDLVVQRGEGTKHCQANAEHTYHIVRVDGRTARGRRVLRGSERFWTAQTIAILLVTPLNKPPPSPFQERIGACAAAGLRDLGGRNPGRAAPLESGN